MSGAPEQARIEALIADLRKVPAFVDQPQADLEWFVAQSEERRVGVGEVSVREDTPADTMFVMLEGELRARRENGPQDGPVFTARAGEVTGVLPFSRMKTFSVTGRAVLPVRALASQPPTPRGRDCADLAAAYRLRDGDVPARPRRRKTRSRRWVGLDCAGPGHSFRTCRRRRCYRNDRRGKSR